MGKAAALYVRSSKDRHDVSIDAQKRELLQLASSEGDHVVEIFEDKVESAKTDARPKFQEIMAKVQKKDCAFKRIYCYDTSRFSRRQLDAKMYKHLLKKNDIDLVFLKLPKTDTFVDQIIESIMEIFDEFHSVKSRMDGLRGMKENVMQGWRAGGRAPAGYKLEHETVGYREGLPVKKSKLVKDPQKWPIVQLYMKGRANGESRMGIKKRLEINLAANALISWEENALTYAGHTVWNRHNPKEGGGYVGGKKYRKRSEWVINRNTHESVITDEEADQILAQREANRRSYKRYRATEYLLTKILRCACGKFYSGNAGYYRCSDRCGNRSIKKERIEGLIFEVIEQDLLKEENFRFLKLEIEKELKKDSKNGENESREIEKYLKKIDKDLEKLVQLILEVENRRPLVEKIDSLEKEREGLIRQQEELKQTNSTPLLMKISDDEIKAFLSDFKTGLAEGVTEQKKAIIQTLVREVVLKGNSVEVAPNVERLTGFKLASPGGFEPPSPP